MASAVRARSSLAYPDRFHAAASYVGFDGSPNSSTKDVSAKFSTETALLFYALYQQATVGPCNVEKPGAWNPVDQSKWTSWKRLGNNMCSAEAMRLFVKILEEEDAGWYSKASNFVSQPVLDVQSNDIIKPDTSPGNEDSNADTKTIPFENGIVLETLDKDVVSEGLDLVRVYDQWVTPPVSHPLPKARYEHGAAVIHDKMYIFGGNHNGRYLNDIQVLNMKNWTWSKIEAKVLNDLPEEAATMLVPPCAGHSLVSWDNKLLCLAGHTKDISESVHVRIFNPETETWSSLKTYGKRPVSRGGQSASLVGTNLVVFGGQDASRTLLNDLHILDLESMTWDEVDAAGVAPSPRSDHAAAVHASRYLLIFGGGSHATCFNDLHVLDLQTMEWSRPAQQGDVPTPRAGHASVTVGENWFIVGGGDNKTGVSETVMLNMATLVWSVVTAVEGRTPVASEGLSLVVGSFSGQDILVSFGGYNGKYVNEVNLLKPSHKSTLESKIRENAVPDSVSAVPNATTRDVESDIDNGPDGRVREIVMYNGESTRPAESAAPAVEEGSSSSLLAQLMREKDEMESSLHHEKLQSVQLMQKVDESQSQNSNLYKELQSVRTQLAAEQSRCFKLEVDVAELRQKLQAMESLERELELVQRQKAASEQAAALSAKQKSESSPGVWGWLAGNPPR